MMSVTDYIKIILKKKKWTNVEFCKKINELEAKLGDERTSPQNISNVLNGQWAIRPKMLAKWEVVLGLMEGTLVSMVREPLSKEGKKELQETKKKLKGVKL